MINYYLTFHKSIKNWFDSLRFYGNYESKQPKAILTAIMLKDFMEWTEAEYLGTDKEYEEVYETAKSLINNLLITNCSFAVTKENPGEPEYSSVNDGSSRMQWLRVIDAPDYSRNTLSILLGSGFEESDASCSMNNYDYTPECGEPKVVDYPTVLIQQDTNHHPVLRREITICDSMDLYHNTVTNEVFQYDYTNKVWVLLNPTPTVDTDPKVIKFEVEDPVGENNGKIDLQIGVGSKVSNVISIPVVTKEDNIDDLF